MISQFGEKPRYVSAVRYNPLQQVVSVCWAPMNIPPTKVMPEVCRVILLYSALIHKGTDKQIQDEAQPGVDSDNMPNKNKRYTYR